MDDRIWFELYESCGNRSVGRVSVFYLQWCGWRRWGVGRVLDQGLEGRLYVCVSCESRFVMYMAGPAICILY